ncbi:MAG: hypothetical protein QXG86_00065 [Candidatus Woesearchaeota archaeon]
MDQTDFNKLVTSFNSVKKVWNDIYTLLMQYSNAQDEKTSDFIKKKLIKLSAGFLNDCKKLLRICNSYIAAITSELSYIENRKDEGSKKEKQLLINQREILFEMKKNLEKYLQIENIEYAIYKFNIKKPEIDIITDINSIMACLRTFSNILGNRDDRVVKSLIEISQMIEPLKKIKGDYKKAVFILQSIKSEAENLASLISIYTKKEENLVSEKDKDTLKNNIKNFFILWNKLVDNVYNIINFYIGEKEQLPFKISKDIEKQFSQIKFA